MRKSISRSSVPLEKSMPFAEPLSKELFSRNRHSNTSLSRQIDRRIVAHRASSCDGLLLTPAREATTHLATPGAMPRLMLKTAVRFAKRAKTVVANLLLAIISWCVAEFLAGCAAYATAMYPPPLMTDEQIDSVVSVTTGWATFDTSPLKRETQLTVIAGNRNYEALYRRHARSMLAQDDSSAIGE
jgi:hypothetical protein